MPSLRATSGRLLFIFICFALVTACHKQLPALLPTVQSLRAGGIVEPPGRGDLRFVFYNVENLFDTADDTTALDDEFLPWGIKGWTQDRYREKLRKIYKVMVNVGGWELPEIIGLCEIENRTVLQDLLDHTPLSRADYAIVHHDSPDIRGIDLGFLYRVDAMTLLSHRAVTVVFPFDPVTTRDILYVEGRVATGDTLHTFLCHFPSRRGGQAASEPRRMYVAGMVRAMVDSILLRSPQAAILIAGDFNDEPTDRSITTGLRAGGQWTGQQPGELFNYMYAMKLDGKGSYKYGGYWNMLDQLMVSAALRDSSGSLFVRPTSAGIYDRDWLLKEDPDTPGKMPFRTFSGARYQGGYSDHLPVWLDIYLRSGISAP